MDTITIALSDEDMKKLREIAGRFHVSLEDLVRASVDDLLARPQEEFQRALEYVLNKNADLYRRLA